MSSVARGVGPRAHGRTPRIRLGHEDGSGPPAPPYGESGPYGELCPRGKSCPYGELSPYGESCPRGTSHPYGRRVCVSVRHG